MNNLPGDVDLREHCGRERRGIVPVLVGSLAKICPIAVAIMGGQTSSAHPLGKPAIPNSRMLA